MKRLISFYNSKYKYLILGYVFMGFGVYNVLLNNKSYFEMLFIISLTQFALYAFFSWKSKLTEKKC